MKLIFLLVLISLISFSASALEFIRINQLGYLPHSVKVAVYFSDQEKFDNSFQLLETLSGKLIFEGKAEPADASMWGQKTALRLDFSQVKLSGGFYLKV